MGNDHYLFVNSCWLRRSSLLIGYNVINDLPIFRTYFDSYKFITNNNYLLGIAYTSWGIAGLSLLIIVCLCGKINLAIAVLKAAADFSRDVCQAIFVPIGLFVVILAFFAFWIYISIYIYSSGPVT